MTKIVTINLTITSIALLALVIGISSVSDAMAGVQTLVVDDDGNAVEGDCDSGTAADYDNIQEAVDNAGTGDIIIVCPGTYNESVDVDTVEDLSIKGITKPIVDGSSPAFVITKDGTHLAGFEVKNDDGDCIVIAANDVKINGILTSGCEDDGIEADGLRISIRGSNLSGNDDNGIECNDCDDAVIKGNVISDNGDHGVLCRSCDGSVIQGNVANGNGDDGIRLTSSSDGNLVRGNTANGNGDDGIVLRSGSDENTIANNTTNGNDDNGIEVDGDDNTIRNNTANNNGDNGIHLEDDAEMNDVAHNTTNDNSDLGIFDESTSQDNTFDKNRCRNNGSDSDDGSEPDGLCKPQD